MIRTLLVNHDGHLSALPTPDEFSLGGFACSPERFYCYEVEVSENDLANIWLNRDRTVVLSVDCPLKVPADSVDPTYFYAAVVAGVPLRLVPVAVPPGVDLAYAKAMGQLRLSEQFTREKGRRFVSAALGNDRWYDGADFLLFAMAFVQRGVAGPFSCSPTAQGRWGAEAHTPEQVQAVGFAYSVWYGALQARFYQAQAAMEAAQSVGAADAVVF